MKILLWLLTICGVATASTWLFVPASGPTPVFWVIADTQVYSDTTCLTPATVDGTAVNCWKDQSGGGHHVVRATTGSDPVYKTSVQNSLPGIRFGGTTGQQLVAPANSSLDPSHLTWFLVGKLTNTSTGGDANGSFFIKAGATSAQDAVYGAVWLTSPNKIDFAARFGGGAWIDGPQSGAISRSTYYTLAGRADGSTAQVYVNGTQAGTGSYGAVSTVSGPLSVGGIAGSFGTASALRGDVLEVRIYGSALSDGEVDTVNNALRAKWATW